LKNILVNLPSETVFNCHCEGVTRLKQSHNVLKKMEIAALPLVARALKDDTVILRKCPWGAMTGA
jgi:hypothetical protein